MSNDKQISFLFELLRKKSITPQDAGCMDLIKTFLEELGFSIKIIDTKNTRNMIASYLTHKARLAFIGHTDVVETGPLTAWNTDPFQPTIVNDTIYGRGAADMKGNLCAFLFAIEKYLKKSDTINFGIDILLTSAEEGSFCAEGIPSLIPHLPNKKVKFCIVGEPTSDKKLGDTIKIGRRGSLSGDIKVQGIGGHVAYPQLTSNPVYMLADVIQTLNRIQFNDSTAAFLASNLEITNVSTNNSSGNVIPQNAFLQFNIRYSGATTAEKIRLTVEESLTDLDVKHEISWTHYGFPYVTKETLLTDIATRAIKKITNITPMASSSGGTSDGRYIAKYCDNILEFGCLNDSIHKPNENIPIKDFNLLINIYHEILQEIEVSTK